MRNSETIRRKIGSNRVVRTIFAIVLLPVFLLVSVLACVVFIPILTYDIFDVCRRGEEGL